MKLQHEWDNSGECFILCNSEKSKDLVFELTHKWEVVVSPWGNLRQRSFISSHLYPIPSHPISPHIVPCYLISSHPLHPAPFHPILSCPVLSCPIPSHYVPSHPISFHFMSWHSIPFHSGPFSPTQTTRIHICIETQWPSFQSNRQVLTQSWKLRSQDWEGPYLAFHPTTYHISAQGFAIYSCRIIFNKALSGRKACIFAPFFFQTEAGTERFSSTNSCPFQGSSLQL